MNDDMWNQAEKLARRPYAVTTEKDILSDGQEVWVARHPELPGCIAQGDTPNEAKANLAEARVDYIYALLELGLEIPDLSYDAPQAVTIGNLPIHSFNASTSASNQTDAEQSDEASSDYRTQFFTLSPQGKVAEYSRV